MDITLIALVSYLGVVLSLGFIAHRRSQQTTEDYFLAGRGVGLVLLVGTIVATIVNGLAVTGTPALFYEGGVLFGQMFVAVLGCTTLMWIFGPRICSIGRESGAVTQGELFANHYGSRAVLAWVAALGTLSILPFLSIQLVGIGKIVTATTRGAISLEEAVGLCALCVGVYVFMGGARAAVWTDAFQGVVALAFFLASAVLFTIWVGGLPTSIEKVALVMPEKLVFNRSNTPIFVDNVLSWTFAFFLWPHVFQRMFMARTPTSVRRSAGLSFVVFSFLLMCLLVMTITATGEFYGAIDDPDQLLAAMFERHMPAGGALLTIVVFALGMSTMDSMLLAVSSSTSRDLWTGLLGHEGRPGIGRERWLTLSVLALAALFGLTAIGRSAITPWVTLGASIATLLLWPLLGMFVFRRASGATVVAAMSLGFLAICAARFTPVGDLLPVGFATTGFLVGGLSFLVGLLIRPHGYSHQFEPDRAG